MEKYNSKAKKKIDRLIDQLIIIGNTLARGAGLDFTERKPYRFLHLCLVSFTALFWLLQNDC